MTFGVKCSPYLATQVLRHIADSHKTSNPNIASAIHSDFYVDNLLSGAGSVEEADALRRRLCELLGLHGMTLCKRKSSSEQLRSLIPAHLLESQELQITTTSEVPKAMGVHWDSSKDTLHISTPVSPTTEGKITKRIITLDTAKVFYVHSLFVHAVIPAHILLQDLWKLPLSWD